MSGSVERDADLQKSGPWKLLSGKTEEFLAHMHIFGHSPFTPLTVAGDGRGLTELLIRSSHLTLSNFFKTLLNIHAYVSFSTQSF